MATLKDVPLGFAITSKWNGAGVAAARADILKLSEEIAKISDKPIIITAEANVAAAKAQIEELAAMLKDRAVVIDVATNAGDAAAQMDVATASAAKLVEQEALLTAALADNTDALELNREAQAALDTTLATVVGLLGDTVAALEANTVALGEMTVAASSAAEAMTATGAAAAGTATRTAEAGAAAATAGSSLDTFGKASTLIVAGGLYEAAHAAGQFTSSIDHLIASTDIASHNNMPQFQQALLDISNQTGVTADDLANAAYRVQAWGQLAGNTTGILRTAAQLAQIDFSNLDKTTQALVTTMGDYNIASTQQVGVANALREAVGKSGLTLEEFSTNIAKVESVASALGIDFTQVYGALATLDKTGLNAQSSITLLSAAMTALAKSSKNQEDEFKVLGINANEFHQTLASKQGLTGAMEMLTDAIQNKLGPDGLIYFQEQTKAAKGNTDALTQSLAAAPPQMQTVVDALAKASGGSRNLAVLLQLTNGNLKNFKDITNDVAAAALKAGKDVDGWSVMQDSFKVRTEKAKEALHNLFIEIGIAVMPAVSGLLGVFTALGDFLQHHVVILEILGGVLVTASAMWIAYKIAMGGAAIATDLFTAATKIAEGAMAALDALMALNPFAWIIVAVGLAVVALQQFFTKTAEGKQIWADITGFFKKGADGVSGFGRVLHGITDELKHLWDATAPVRDALGKLFGPDVILAGQHILKAFRDLGDFWKNHIQPEVKELGKTLGELWTTIKPLAELVGIVLVAGFKILSDVLKNVVGPVISFIADLFRNIVMFIKGVVQVITGVAQIIKGLVEVVAGVLKLIYDLITGNWGKLGKDIHNIWESIKNDIWGGLKNLGKGIASIVSAIFDTIVSLFVNGGKAVLHTLGSWWQDITGWFHKLWDHLVGHSIVPDTINGITSWFGKLPGKIMGGLGSFVGGVVGHFTNLGKDSVNEVKKLWSDIQNAFSSGVKLVKDLWDRFWNGLKGIFTSVLKFLSDLWQSEVNGWKVVWDTVSGAIKAAWDAFWNALKDAVTAIWDGLKTLWSDFVTGVKIVWDDVSKDVTEAWNTFWTWLHDFVVDIWDKVTNKFTDWGNGIRSMFGSLVTDLKNIWNSIEDLFKTPLNFVIGLYNDHIAGTFGLPKIPALAEGGPVVGPGGPTEDKVLIRASAGEHMWTADEVNAVGGQGAMYRLRQQVMNRKGNIFNDNSNLPAFATGGAIPPNLQTAIDMAKSKGDGRAYVYGGSGPDGFDCSGFQSAIYNALTGAADFWSRSFTTESDFGALGFQRGLSSGFSIGVHNGGGGMNSHMAGTLNGVNVESGGSSDATNYGGPAAGADSGQFENQYNYPLNGVNGQFVSGGGGGKGPGIISRALSSLFTHLTNPIVDGVPRPFSAFGFNVPEPFGDIPHDAVKKARDDVLAKILGTEAAHPQYGAAGGVGSIPDGDHLRIITDALNAAKIPPPNSMDAWTGGMNTLISRESGWNPNAVNNSDSNAAAGTPSQGLAQVIQPTFDSYHVAGTANNILDPVANVAAAASYIVARYGDIANVQQANPNLPPQGYAGGTKNAKAGWSMVGENGPEAVNFRGGEAVYSFDDIVNKLKDGATGVSREMSDKNQQGLQNLGDRLVAALQQVQQATQQNTAATTQASGSSSSSNSPNCSASGGQNDQFSNVLSMMLRQGVGGK